MERIGSAGVQSGVGDNRPCDVSFSSGLGSAACTENDVSFFPVKGKTTCRFEWAENQEKKKKEGIF